MTSSEAYPIADMGSETDTLLTRQSLLARLRDPNDDGSWKTFFDRYSMLIYNVARKAGFADAAAQDIVQETFVTVARHMPDFQYNPALGSFKSWLLQITRSRMFDALRRKHTRRGNEYIPREQALGTSLLESQSTESGLDAIWDQEWREHLLKVAMEHVKQKADLRQFQIFCLHVVKGVPALQVARRLGVKLPEVYFAKYKVSARLKKEIRRLERG